MAKKNEKMSVYMETNPESEPVALQIGCPICGAEAGIWCAVLIPLGGFRIGLVHQAREEADKDVH